MSGLFIFLFNTLVLLVVELTVLQVMYEYIYIYVCVYVCIYIYCVYYINTCTKTIVKNGTFILNQCFLGTFSYPFDRKSPSISALIIQ